VNRGLIGIFRGMLRSAVLKSVCGNSGQIIASRSIVLHIHPLLGNGLVNTFPQKQTRGTKGRLFLDNVAVNTHR
jgi:hypothetical protein